MAAARSARARLGAARRRIASARVGDIEPRIVWIFGSPRSGSTWLLQLLGDHERVVPVNEPLIGHYLGLMLADVVDIDVDLGALDTTNFTVRRARAGSADDFFAEEFREVWQPALGEMMRKRFAAHVRRRPGKVPASKAVVAIQEPNGSHAADVIMASLPRSTFVFLLRDGRDVIDSILASSQPGGWFLKAFPGLIGIPEGGRMQFIERSARKWLWRTEVVQAAFAAHPGPKHLLRYEDLRADTAGRLRPLLAGLGLELDDGRLAALIERHAFERVPAASRGATGFVRAASPGLWRENLSGEEQDLVEDLLGPKLRELGYER
jgi:Sulfotransferase family